MEEEKKSTGSEEAPKRPLQQKKEEWYDRIPLSKKQMDKVVYVCFGALILVFILIFLEAFDIFTLFPKK